MVTRTDYLVVGAGPAGLQLGYFLRRARRDYLILEADGTPGSFFRTFPRHRHLISINKPHTGFDDPELNLRMDWNSLLSDRESLLFTRYTKRYFPNADVMVRYLADYAEALGLNIRYDTRVVRVSREGERFVVVDQNGAVYQAPLLIVATGPAKPYLPSIPGIETAELYGTVTVDPRDFLDQRVLIIGKGNSAFETAENLVESAAVIHIAGPGTVRMAWQSRCAGHLRAVNSNFLDTYRLRAQNALLDGQVRRIEPSGDGYRVLVGLSRSDTVTELRYDRVIACTGFRFDSSIFADGCRPELTVNDRFPAQTSSWESVNVPDLYFAGTLMQGRDFDRSASGFIHGFRYCVKALHRILERRYHGRPWPPRGLPAEAEPLMVAVLCRANRTSALWQQFGQLCDLIVVEGTEAAYYEELPVDYVHDSKLGESENYFMVTLEYDPSPGDKVDLFNSPVRGVPDETHLHPVIRHYNRAELIAEHHVAPNLENVWTDERTHRDPLRAFFDSELALHRAPRGSDVTSLS